MDALRTVLTAKDATDTYFLCEAILTTGAEEGVRITCACDARACDQLEDTFLRTIASIRRAEQRGAVAGSSLGPGRIQTGKGREHAARDNVERVPRKGIG